MKFENTSNESDTIYIYDSFENEIYRKISERFKMPKI